MDFPERKNDSSKNAEDFIRLKDKESVTGVFAGKPYLYEKHWNGKHFIECTHPDVPCAFCSNGDRARFSFRLNFVTKGADGKNVAKIFEQGPMVYDAIRALAVGGYDLSRTVVTISRKGATKDDTVYSVVPLPPPNGVLTDKGLAVIKAIPLHDLAPTHQLDPSNAMSGQLTE